MVMWLTHEKLSQTQVFVEERCLPALKRIVNLDKNEALQEHQSGFQTKLLKCYIAIFE
jgi:hypothetical protein